MPKNIYKDEDLEDPRKYYARLGDDEIQKHTHMPLDEVFENIPAYTHHEPDSYGSHEETLRAAERKRLTKYAVYGLGAAHIASRVAVGLYGLYKLIKFLRSKYGGSAAPVQNAPPVQPVEPASSPRQRNKPVKRK